MVYMSLCWQEDKDASPEKRPVPTPARAEDPPKAATPEAAILKGVVRKLNLNILFEQPRILKYAFEKLGRLQKRIVSYI